ncbi:hypothetical protein BT69DRAFT_351597 [Atractiella rhizophila]|nr:hypothetical protein BT69DRAFT_351597 [Atractiella rhizophila]
MSSGKMKIQSHSTWTHWTRIQTISLMRTASVSKLATTELHKTSSRSKLPPVPDWIDKPPPEVYKNLSSKEKRQLRNKISARNFRHRRKEYITTLEEAVQARDSVISNLRAQLDGLTLENSELKRENKEIKAKWDEMLSKINISVTSPKSPNTIAAALASRPEMSPTPKRMTNSSSSIPQLNVNKDVGVNGKRWGQSAFGGGYTSVHRTLVPELRFADSSSSSSSSSSSPSSSSSTDNITPPPAYSQLNLPTNMNPALNNLSPTQTSLLPLFTAHLRASGMPGKTEGKGVHDDFFGSNPYNLRPDLVEEYRSQLYGKLANNLAYNAVMQKTGGADATMEDAEAGRHRASALAAGGWRPAFFTSPKSNDKKLAKDPSPPPSYDPSPLMASQIAPIKPNVASDSTGLLSKMAETFWLTFSGGNDLGIEPKKRSGTLERSLSVSVGTSSSSSDSLDELGSKLGKMKLGETSSKKEVKVDGN